MKGLVKGLLALAGFTAEAAAQDVVWRSQSGTAHLGRPAPLSAPAPVTLLTPARYQAKGGETHRLVQVESPKDGEGKPDHKEDWKAPRPSPITRPSPDCGPGVWGSFAADPYCNPIPCEGLPNVEAAASAPIDGGVKVSQACGLCGWSLTFRPEYLLWWIRDSRYPVLLTTGPAETAGVLGAPGTRVLFGGDEVSNGARSGARLTLGLWCDPEQTYGVEASAFFLAEKSVNFVGNSSAFPVLTRPFVPLNTPIDPTMPLRPGEVATAPELSVGSVSISTPSQLWGAELNARCKWCCDCWGRLDWLGGIRYLDLDEGLRITESLRTLPGNMSGLPGGTQITVVDQFDTRNQFVGGQVGAICETNWGRWSLEGRAKLALGSTHQVVTINGSQLIVRPDGTSSAAVGGLLALPTNIGRYTRDRFSVVPELGLTVGWQATDWLRLTTGYTFLYWSNVVRPGDQIDPVLDVTNIPNGPPNALPTGQRRPAPTLRETDFWAQGFSFGLELRW